MTPAIYISELKYVIKINSSLETIPKDIRKENGNYITDNVNVSYSGKYFYYTTKPYYLTLCMFPAEIKESSLMQDVVIKECRDLARYLLCRTILASRHITGTQEKHINVSNISKANV